jgi:mannose-1-phosphate guanylyltransferase
MFAVIMAGGSGTRFWPVSRAKRPKQFLDITGKGPMVVETCQRLRPVTREEDLIIIVGQEHLMLVKSLFEGSQAHVLAEPVGRNTAPCIGLGAIYAEYLGCTGVVAFLPADHFIGDPKAFLKALLAAGKLAESGGIVTLGIPPTKPETGYGYIRRGEDDRDILGISAYRVLEFVEKPDFEQAHKYLSSGEYYWNGGIFVATPKTIVDAMKEHLPDLHRGLLKLRDALQYGDFEEEFREVYEDLRGISFDYGVMEKIREKVYVVPCECGWSDVGSWSSLHDLRKTDHDTAKNLCEGETVLIDCERSMVLGNSGRLVACLGLRNSLVVDTPETLLVADLDRSQDVKKIVDQLKKSGKEELL